MNSPQAQTIQEQNKHVLLRWFEEVWNQGRHETIHELFAPNAILHDGSQKIIGPEAFLDFYNALHADFSDFRITPGVSLTEGDLAAIHWSLECVHKSTRKPVSLTGLSIVRIKDGRFVEAWQNWDQAGLATQIS